MCIEILHTSERVNLKNNVIGSSMTLIVNSLATLHTFYALRFRTINFVVTTCSLVKIYPMSQYISSPYNEVLHSPSITFLVLTLIPSPIALPYHFSCETPSSALTHSYCIIFMISYFLLPLCYLIFVFFIGKE